MLVTGLVFSFMQGIFHAYYTVALAPAIGALVGIGSVVLWRRGDDLARYVLGATLASTAIWAYVLLGRSPDFVSLLRVAVLVIGLATAAVLAGGAALPRRIVSAVAATAVLIALTGPPAYAVQTASQPHTGAIPTAGPLTAMSGPGGMPGRPAGGPPTGMGISYQAARQAPNWSPCCRKAPIRTPGSPPRSEPTAPPDISWRRNFL